MYENDDFCSAGLVLQFFIVSAYLYPRHAAVLCTFDGDIIIP